jgi:hypothetical protein
MTDLPFHDGQESPATLNGAGGRGKCRRHDWAIADGGDDLPPVYQCVRCDRVRDSAASRRGRTALRAGKDAERAIVAAYRERGHAARRTGQYGGPDDALVGDLFVVQSKAGGWFSNRVWSELVKLPRSGGRIPTLIVSDRPGPGHRTRRYVVRMIDDDLDLHGAKP